MTCMAQNQVIIHDVMLCLIENITDWNNLHCLHSYIANQDDYFYASAENSWFRTLKWKELESISLIKQEVYIGVFWHA